MLFEENSNFRFTSTVIDCHRRDRDRCLVMDRSNDLPMVIEIVPRVHTYEFNFQTFTRPYGSRFNHICSGENCNTGVSRFAKAVRDDGHSCKGAH